MAHIDTAIASRLIVVTASVDSIERNSNELSTQLEELSLNVAELMAARDSTDFTDQAQRNAFQIRCTNIQTKALNMNTSYAALITTTETAIKDVSVLSQQDSIVKDDLHRLNALFDENRRLITKIINSIDTISKQFLS